MATKASGSFDIVLGMEDVGGRSNICLAFGSGLFRKLGWSSGDWLQFDLSQERVISLTKVDEPSETSFYAKEIKLVNGFYKLCIYTKAYAFPYNTVELAKDQATYNVHTRTLSLNIPEAYVTPPEPEVPPSKILRVEDIAAAFSKL